MFSIIKRLLQRVKKPKPKTVVGDINIQQQATLPGERVRDIGKLSRSLEDNIAYLKESVGKSDDLRYRRFQIGDSKVAAVVVWVDSLTDEDRLVRGVLEPLLFQTRQAPPPRLSKQGILEVWKTLRDQILTVNAVTDTTDFDLAVIQLLSGRSLLFLEGVDRVLMLSTQGWAQRGIESPVADQTIRGPRDAFTETLKINVAQIRRRLRDPKLRVKLKRVGARGVNDIALVYVEDLVNPIILDTVKKRLDAIDVDAVLESGYLEQLIEENWLSPFPTILSTERPDEVAGQILEGRVALLTDNTPFAVIAPATFDSLFHAAEDYYQKWQLVSAIRLFRFAATMAAIFVPAAYVALTTYHQGMLPSKLAIAISATRQGVPLPAVGEAFLMLFLLELLREAGVRLPTPLGQTIGIVGGLIIGQAAVQAGLISDLMVIIVATTAISSFTIPDFESALALRLLAFPMLIAAGTFGLYGLTMAILIMFIHLAAMKSFGVPYLVPFAPLKPKALLRDTIARAPWMSMKRRPAFFASGDRDRMDDRRDS